MQVPVIFGLSFVTLLDKWKSVEDLKVEQHRVTNQLGEKENKSPSMQLDGKNVIWMNVNSREIILLQLQANLLNDDLKVIPDFHNHYLSSYHVYKSTLSFSIGAFYIWGFLHLGISSYFSYIGDDDENESYPGSLASSEKTLHEDSFEKRNTIAITTWTSVVVFIFDGLQVSIVKQKNMEWSGESRAE